MKLLIVTNNAEVESKYGDQYFVKYQAGSYKDVLLAARDYVHGGHELLTHPLSGSVKPNETPFKTVLLSATCKQLDHKSLEIVEQSIETAEKFIYFDRQIPEDILDDFRCIDTDLIDNVISKLA